jgi:hypothetical protein
MYWKIKTYFLNRIIRFYFQICDCNLDKWTECRTKKYWKEQNYGIIETNPVIENRKEVLKEYHTFLLQRTEW